MSKIYVEKVDKSFNINNFDMLVHDFGLEILKDDVGYYIDSDKLDVILNIAISIINDSQFIEKLEGVDIHTKVTFELDKTIYHEE